jgi:2-amino-4-hydroxy-6-hydroxymethyldihydropteridine diphosphokinase
LAALGEYPLKKSCPALIALGSNLSFAGLSPAAVVQAAIAEIGAEIGPVRRTSSLWVSPAWPDPADPSFINAVIEVAARRSDPQELCARLQGIEARYGRVRGARNAPRTLDLDILDLGGRVIIARADDGGVLDIPHPRLGDRGFVLAPLMECAPDWRHPVSGQTAAGLLERLPPTPELRPLALQKVD